MNVINHILGLFHTIPLQKVHEGKENIEHPNINLSRSLKSSRASSWMPKAFPQVKWDFPDIARSSRFLSAAKMQMINMSLTSPLHYQSPKQEVDESLQKKLSLSSKAKW